MVIRELVGRTVTVYLSGGHVLKGKVSGITTVPTASSDGKQPSTCTALSMVMNNHTTMIRLDRIDAYEVHTD